MYLCALLRSELNTSGRDSPCASKHTKIEHFVGMGMEWNGMNACFCSPGSLHAMVRPSHRPIHTGHHLSRCCGAAFIGCSNAGSAPSRRVTFAHHKCHSSAMSRHSRARGGANAWPRCRKCVDLRRYICIPRIIPHCRGVLGNSRPR